MDGERKKNEIKKNEITDVTDATQIRSRKSISESRVLVFVVESPPQLAGKEFEILSPGILGRSTQASITIPEKSVSRRHLFFEPDPKTQRIYIRDLNSTNGTFINGLRVSATHVRPGDKIACGRVVLRFESRSKAEHIVRKKIRADAEIDPLSHLYNRRVLENEMKKLIYEGEPFSIILMDIDNLKKINDTMGHRKGDEAILTLSIAIKMSIRETDIAARYGGDEFIIVLKRATKVIASKIAERIKEKLIDRKKEKLIDREDETRIPISFSFGISEFPHDGRDEESLIRHADEQLYTMKRSKKATFPN